MFGGPPNKPDFNDRMITSKVLLCIQQSRRLRVLYKSKVGRGITTDTIFLPSEHSVGRRGDSTRRASAAKLGSARTYALVGGAARTGAMYCGFSVATGMETRLVLRRIVRALGFQCHEFMDVSNANTV